MYEKEVMLMEIYYGVKIDETTTKQPIKDDASEKKI